MGREARQFRYQRIPGMGIELSGTGRGNEESYSRSSRVKRFHGLVPYLDPDTWTVSIEWDDGDDENSSPLLPFLYQYFGFFQGENKL
jgi:hypothetical protein